MLRSLAAIQYSKDRKVFGAPLIEYPLTQIKIAKMAARFAACRQLAYAVGRMLDSGGGRMEASLVKLLACRSAEMVTSGRKVPDCSCDTIVG